MSTCCSHFYPERGPMLSGSLPNDDNDWAVLLQRCFEPDAPELPDDILTDLDGWVFIEDDDEQTNPPAL